MTEQTQQTEHLPRMRSIPWIMQNYSAELGIGERFLRDLCRENKVRNVRAGRKILVNLDSLFSYLNGNNAE